MNKDGSISDPTICKRNIYVLFISCLLAVVLLYAVFGRSNIIFDELALGAETKSVFASYDGDPIHCMTLADAQRCLAPAVSRKLESSVLWLGNSQLHAINQLKPGELTAPALLAQNLRPEQIEVLAFSQPNASLSEHLVMFESLTKHLPFKFLVLPLVFDDTRETSIRRGVGMAIDEPTVQRELSLGDAGNRIVRQIQASNERDQKQAAETLQTRFERGIVDLLEYCCRWETVRSQARGSISIWLYVTRNTVFNIKPTSIRRKIAPSYDQNLAAAAQTFSRAEAMGIHTIAYIAPIRNDFQKPYDPAEYEAFKEDAARLAKLHSATFMNLEDLVPNNFWGNKDATSVGGAPEIDFMHFRFSGHVLLADAVAGAIARNAK